MLRRIEAISVGIRAIMAGDLTERIALGGSGDELDHLSGTLNAMLERIESLVQGVRQIPPHLDRHMSPAVPGTPARSARFPTRTAW